MHFEKKKKYNLKPSDTIWLDQPNAVFKGKEKKKKKENK